jgi:5-methylcytosine-specific restriction endonuclease McrA
MGSKKTAEEYSAILKRAWETRRKNGNDIPWNKGSKMSKETKKKISQSKQGQTPWNKGKSWSPKMKEKLSKAHLGNHYPKISEGGKGRKATIETRRKMSSQRKGEKHWNWQGGKSSKSERIRKSIDADLWRGAVFSRDNYTCQKCEDKGGKLNAHHIMNFAQYPELRFAIDNGITLCKKCHQKFHKKYGIKNNNEEQMDSFLS